MGNFIKKEQTGRKMSSNWSIYDDESQLSYELEDLLLENPASCLIDM